MSTCLPASLFIQADRGLSVPAKAEGEMTEGPFLTILLTKVLRSLLERGGWGIQGTSSEKPNFDGLAYKVDENSTPPFKIDVFMEN